MQESEFRSTLTSLDMHLPEQYPVQETGDASTADKHGLRVDSFMSSVLRSPSDVAAEYDPATPDVRIANKRMKVASREQELHGTVSGLLEKSDSCSRRLDTFQSTLAADIDGEVEPGTAMNHWLTLQHSLAYNDPLLGSNPLIRSNSAEFAKSPRTQDVWDAATEVD